ncbi:MAG: hypothetical protein IJ228_11805 [Succinivibrio sp.]|nr:hypothetical protein [Succinivibrio sp.]
MSETEEITTGRNPRAADLSRTGYAFNTIMLPSGKVEDLRTLLQEKIAPNREIYENVPVVIDVAEVNYLQDLDYPALQALCREYGMFLLGLSGAITEERAAVLTRRGIPVVNSNRYARLRDDNFKPKVITKTIEVQVPVKVPVPYEVKVPVEVKNPEPLLVISRNVRSGETISAPGNSVLILGSVGSGARVIASHHIIILGDLNGEVYAGSPRNDADPGYPEALIYTQGQFAPTFVAIAGNYQTAEDIEKDPLNNAVAPLGYGQLVTLQGKALHYRSIRIHQQGTARN